MPHAFLAVRSIPAKVVRDHLVKRSTCLIAHCRARAALGVACAFFVQLKMESSRNGAAPSFMRALVIWLRHGYLSQGPQMLTLWPNSEFQKTKEFEMWLLTPVGFFSIVQKPTDVALNTLTVRARVKGDLEALRERYLNGMSDIKESRSNDYRFRAVVPRADVAAAMSKMIEDLDYSNFKGEVAKVQGHAREHVYHDVWSVLYRLQKD